MKFIFYFLATKCTVFWEWLNGSLHCYIAIAIDVIYWLSTATPKPLGRNRELVEWDRRVELWWVPVDIGWPRWRKWAREREIGCRGLADRLEVNSRTRFYLSWLVVVIVIVYVIVCYRVRTTCLWWEQPLPLPLPLCFGSGFWAMILSQDCELFWTSCRAVCNWVGVVVTYVSNQHWMNVNCATKLFQLFTDKFYVKQFWLNQLQ